MQGPARGYPLWTCFLQCFKKDFNKENNFFEQGISFDLVKVCFVFAFEKHAITIKKIEPQLTNTKEKKKMSARARKVVLCCKC